MRMRLALRVLWGRESWTLFVRPAHPLQPCAMARVTEAKLIQIGRGSLRQGRTKLAGAWSGYAAQSPLGGFWVRFGGELGVLLRGERKVRPTRSQGVAGIAGLKSYPIERTLAVDAARRGAAAAFASRLCPAPAGRALAQPRRKRHGK